MKKYLNIIFIIVILVVIFLSQQSFFQEKGGYVPLKLADFWKKDLKPKTEVFFDNTKTFFQEQVLARITGEVEKRKEIVKEEFGKEKEKIEEEIEKKEEEIKESIWQKIKSFFSEKFNLSN